MNSKYIISELQRNKHVFKELLKNLGNEIIIWKQVPEKWSLLEIVCHLYDEEREDFKARLMGTLENPELEFNPIDPPGWVTSRNYLDQDFNSKLNDFLQERENSIDYFKKLTNPKWDNFYKHPTLGKLTAKMFFTNWLAHDYLHIRQIIKLKFNYLQSVSDESLSYAGEW